MIDAAHLHKIIPSDRLESNKSQKETKEQSKLHRTASPDLDCRSLISPRFHPRPRANLQRPDCESPPPASPPRLHPNLESPSFSEKLCTTTRTPTQSPCQVFTFEAPWRRTVEKTIARPPRYYARIWTLPIGSCLRLRCACEASHDSTATACETSTEKPTHKKWRRDDASVSN